MASTTCWPMVSTGLSDVIGSWKIIEIALPRSAQISSSGRVCRSRPSNTILPDTRALSGNRRSSDSAVVDLPQPDSPTSASVSPASMPKLRFLTASWPGKDTLRLRMSRSWLLGVFLWADLKTYLSSNAAAIACARMQLRQAGVTGKQLFAQSARCVVMLVGATRLQFRDDQIDEGFEAFRRHRAGQVETVDIGLAYPCFQLIGNLLRRADDGGVAAAEFQLLQQLSLGPVELGIGHSLDQRFDGIGLDLANRFVEFVL